jgi:hypothetical protein
LSDTPNLKTSVRKRPSEWSIFFYRSDVLTPEPANYVN